MYIIFLIWVWHPKNKVILDSGKWILHPSYVEACLDAKKILSNYTDFEWGNPEKDFMQEINPKEQQLAKTAYR